MEPDGIPNRDQRIAWNSLDEQTGEPMSPFLLKAREILIEQSQSLLDELTYRLSDSTLSASEEADISRNIQALKEELLHLRS